MFELNLMAILPQMCEGQELIPIQMKIIFSEMNISGRPLSRYALTKSYCLHENTFA